MPYNLRAVPRLLLLLLLLAISPAPRAAAPQYTLELLLFEPTTVTGEERWEEFLGELDNANAVVLGAPGADPAFRRLPTSALGAAAHTLKSSGRYRLLAHLAWRQPSYGSQQTRPIFISGGERLAAGGGYAVGDTTLPTLRRLEGSVRVHVGKYLHVELDLLYRRNRPPSPEGTVVAQAAAPLPPIQTLRIQNKRRMRSKELHYLDHPLVGALVIAHPYDPEDPPSR